MVLSSTIATLGSIVLGALLVDVHERTGRRDQTASLERIALAARGTETSSSAVTAFDLATWSDTFVARGAGPASSLVALDLAALPDSAAVRIDEPPAMVASLAERSPPAVLLGAFDLAWVLALVLPLAAIALGFDSIARDREKGTLAMLLAPAERGAPLVRARMLSNAVALWIGVVPIAVVGEAAYGAIDGRGVSFGLAAGLALLLSAYVLFLAAVVSAVSALADRSATALAVLVAGWLLIFVALPLATGAIVRAAYPRPDPRARLDGEMAAQDVYQRPSASTLDEEAAKDPGLDPSLGTEGVSIQNRYYMLLAREHLHRARAARYEEETTLLSRIELSEIAAWLSPATIVANGVAALAGTTARERIEFAKDAERYRVDLEAFVRARVLANESRFSAPESWPRFERIVKPTVAVSLAASVLFSIAVLLVALGTGWAFERRDLAPTREDA